MTLRVSISPETEATLRERATAVGEDVADYAAGILERSAKLPMSLEEISGPLADQVRSTGMTEDEISEFLEDEKHKMRRERRAS